jgi:hypothetical protein
VSVTVDVNVTLTAGFPLAVGAVRVDGPRVEVKPGGRFPVHCMPFAEVAPIVARFGPQANPDKTNPDAAGNVKMMPVMANWLDAGFVTVTENPVTAHDASQ